MLDFLGAVGHIIMTPLYYAVSAVMVAGTGCSAWCSIPTPV